LVTVFASSNPAELAVAKMLLEGAGVRYVTTGELVQDVIGVGRLFGGNLITGPVRLQVLAEDADEARELLEPPQPE
jgi:hypothetical protein